MDRLTTNITIIQFTKDPAATLADISAWVAANITAKAPNGAYVTVTHQVTGSATPMNNSH